MRHLRLLGAAAMLAVAAYFLAAALIRPGEARAEIFGSNGGQGGDVSSITTGTLPQVRGGTGTGALSCAAGQKLTSNGTAYSCAAVAAADLTGTISQVSGATSPGAAGKYGMWAVPFGQSSSPPGTIGKHYWGMNLSSWLAQGGQSLRQNNLLDGLTSTTAGDKTGFLTCGIASCSEGTYQGRPIVAGVIATDPSSIASYRVVLLMTNAATSGGGSIQFGNLGGATDTIPDTTPVAKSTSFIGLAYDSSRNGNWWLISGDGSNMSGVDTGSAAATGTLYSFIVDAHALVDGSGYSVTLASKAVGSTAAFTSLGTWTKTTNIPSAGSIFGFDFFAVNLSASARKLGFEQFSIFQQSW